MHGRRIILLVTTAVLAARVEAQSTQSEPRRPPSDESRSWQEKNARKAEELGKKGVDAGKRGASAAGKAVNHGGQALNAKIVGTKTVTGHVTRVSRDQVTVKRSEGAPLELRVTDSTKVTVGGQEAKVTSLKQGDEVRASYAQSGGAATATKIDARR